MNETNPTNANALTEREKEILFLIARGYSSKQIAGNLKISEYTVANHRKNMLAKTGAKSSAELVNINNNYIAAANSYI